MPTNPLFWIALGIVTVGYVATLSYLYSRRRDVDGDFHSGRVPGYSYTEGRNVGLDASVVPLDRGDWRPLRLETFHGTERTRLIFSLAFDVERDDAHKILSFLRSLAGEIQSRSDADVVYLQADAKHEMGGRWHYLYAPDGEGWWGREQVRIAYDTPLQPAAIEL